MAFTFEILHRAFVITKFKLSFLKFVWWMVYTSNKANRTVQIMVEIPKELAELVVRSFVGAVVPFTLFNVGCIVWVGVACGCNVVAWIAVVVIVAVPLTTLQQIANMKRTTKRTLLDIMNDRFNFEVTLRVFWPFLTVFWRLKDLRSEVSSIYTISWIIILPNRNRPSHITEENNSH